MKEHYHYLIPQLQGLIEGESNVTAILANVSALLNETLPRINWVGFYLYDKNADELILGPFQGKVACMHIPLDKGVCGKAATTRATQRIDDVHQFPGHIACDGASNSELVVPIVIDGELFGVLDIDSPLFSHFDEEDQRIMEEVVAVLSSHLQM